MNPADVLATGLQNHQRGQLAQAEAAYREVLSVEPHNAEALHMLGVVAYQSGHLETALDLIGQSIDCSPGEPAYFNNLGEVLRALGQPEEAVIALRQAIALKGSDDAELLGNLGVAFLDAGEVVDAEATLRRAIKVDANRFKPHLHLSRLLREKGTDYVEPALYEAERAVTLSKGQSAEAVVNHANTLQAAGRLAEAQQQCERAIALAGNWCVAHSALGSVCLDQSRYTEAASAFSRAIELNPNFAPALSGLGRAMDNLGRIDEALASFERALAITSLDHAAHAGIAMTLMKRFDYAKAAEHWRQVLELKGNNPEHMNQLAVALEETGQFEEATMLLQQASTIDPPHAHVESNLAKRLTAAGAIDEAIAHLQRARQLSPNDAALHSNLLLTLHYEPNISPQELFSAHQQWWREHGQALFEKSAQKKHANDRSENRPLRIGYVSPDLRAHPVADFLEPILANHDRQHFEVFCYSDVRRSDAYTQRMKNHAHSWKDIAGQTDGRVAELIREDRIDILVDLAGHTAGNRMRVFAMKPAPVAATYLGYPDTTGLLTIDWRITDQHADPEENAAFYTESLLRMPRNFLCYQPPDAPDVADLTTGKDRGVTFGSFNNLAKVDDGVLDAWSQILHALPRARMLIKAAGLDAAAARERVLRRFEHHGVPPSRIELTSGVNDSSEHWRLYNKVDIALDTFPYNGTTTTCEALWMGVPVVTLSGQPHMSRVGRSLLTQVGLTDFIASSAEQYVATATALAQDQSRLRELRSTMRDRLRASPLLDAPGVTRELESAYRQMWEKR